MQKNVGGQKIGAQLVSATDGSAFTGSVTVYVTGDAGTQAAGSVGSGACTHEGNGYHTYAPAQAETNYDLIAFTFVGTGAIPATVQLYTKMDANVTTIAGTAQTGRDIGASVLLSSGTGTGQISLSSGAVLLQATQTGVTIPTVTTVTNQLTAAAIATGVWQDATAGDFTTASSIGKSLYTGNVVPGAAGGHFIAGTNAATTITTALTTTFTGNLTGSVASVTGAVGSVAANGITASPRPRTSRPGRSPRSRTSPTPRRQATSPRR
jgi:hypothetical protein